MKTILRHLPLIAFLLLLGCKKKEVINLPPTANAGADIVATVGQKVSLDGSLSKDPEGAALTYRWSFKTSPATSLAKIQNAASANADFTPDQTGVYVLTLTVTDELNQSASASVTVNVSLPGRPPVANAGVSLTTTFGNKVILDGSGSMDPDGDKLTYKWTFKTRPAESATGLSIINDTQVKAEFTPDAVGLYTVSLTVSDNHWGGVVAEMTVLVTDSPTIEICPQNGRIDANTTWKNVVQDPAKPDYVICKDIELNATLTVEPGVLVAFRQNTGITTGLSSGKGALSAIGTSAKPIIFTGEQKVTGFWDGILLLNSANVQNELSYVEISYGGGSIESGYYGKPANLNVAGSRGIGLGPSSVKLTNCTISNSKGRGVYVSPDGILSEATNNKFIANTLYPIELPASQVNLLSNVNTFSASNGINAVGIYGNLSGAKEITWGPFDDGTPYRFLESPAINCGFVLKPGTVIEVASQKAISINSDGYIIAKGTANKRVVFTGVVKAPGSWGGLLLDNNKDVRNELSYAEVSYGGGEPAYLYAAKGNVILFSGFGITGRIKITNTIISNSSEAGIAQYRGTLLLDSPDSNTYANNAKGNVVTQ